MGTKRRILQAALKLFNESNTQAATTNHIAAAAGISPGNLHYHFRNREEIIRKLYVQMRSEFTLLPEAYPRRACDLIAIHEQVFTTQWKYRFLYRELLFLLSRDPELKRLYRADTLAQRRRIEEILQLLAAEGVMVLPDREAVAYLGDMILLIEQFWNSYMQLCDAEGSSVNIRTGVRRIEETLRPYLSEAALAELKGEE